jgi:GNAT superfamily N-acetyltransferase
MPGELDESDLEVAPEDLDIEPFIETRKVKDFDCGNRDLNDFLNTEEVQRYDREGLGNTHLVYFRGNLVAYFTTCLSELRWEYVKHIKAFNRYPSEMVDAYPGIKIGRLAVQRSWQGKGIGTAILRFIAGMALSLRGQHGIRLLILQAKLESIPFYEKNGFILTLETKRERKRKNNRTMFLDILGIREPAAD